MSLSSMISLLALIITYVVGTQKNRLTETILLSTHNIGFGSQIRILEHDKYPLSRALHEETIPEKVRHEDLQIQF